MVGDWGKPFVIGLVLGWALTVLYYGDIVPRLRGGGQ